MLFSIFKDKIELDQQNKSLKIENASLRRQLDRQLKRDENDRIKTDKDYNDLLEKEIAKRDNFYEKKIARKQQKINDLREELECNQKIFKRKYDSINDQVVKILNLNMRVKSFKEILSNFRSEEINAAKAIFQETETFLKQYKYFKKEMLPLIEKEEDVQLEIDLNPESKKEEEIKIDNV